MKIERPETSFVKSTIRICPTSTQFNQIKHNSFYWQRETWAVILFSLLWNKVVFKYQHQEICEVKTFSRITPRQDRTTRLVLWRRDALNWTRVWFSSLTDFLRTKTHRNVKVFSIFEYYGAGRSITTPILVKPNVVTSPGWFQRLNITSDATPLYFGEFRVSYFVLVVNCYPDGHRGCTRRPEEIPFPCQEYPPLYIQQVHSITPDVFKKSGAATRRGQNLYSWHKLPHLFHNISQT